MTKKIWAECQRGVELTDFRMERSTDRRHIQLSEEWSYKINEQEDEREVLLIERSSKLERRYWLVVRLKAIKYKEDFLYYLSSPTSF